MRKENFSMPFIPPPCHGLITAATEDRAVLERRVTNLHGLEDGAHKQAGRSLWVSTATHIYTPSRTLCGVPIESHTVTHGC
jgi:hypothetical protein